MLRFVESFLIGWGKLAILLERVLVDNIAAVTPWLAPLVPAYIAYHNMIDELGFDIWIATFAAITIECLGLSAVSTALKFWQYNDTKRKTDDSAPFLIALTAGVFYIVIVLTVNAVLEISDTLEVRILAQALLTLLSVPAAVIIAIRSQHRGRLERIAQEKEERREERRVARLQKSATPTQPIATPSKHNETFEPIFQENPGVGPVELEQLTGINRGTASRWLKTRRNGQ